MQPTQDEVRLQLGRVLASDAFSNADRLSRFLRYVVERALAGEADRLKEFVVGTDVFDRGDSYDPRLDSIVRVEAGRLRAKLDEYYNGKGSGDPVIIRMRRGSYAPDFERREAPQPVERPFRRRIALGAAAALMLIGIIAWRAGPWTPDPDGQAGITIAVLPFASYSHDEAATLLAARVTDGVTSELARRGGLSVVSHTSALQFAGARRSLREVARSLDADVLMEGSVLVEGDRLRVQARLVDAARDRKFWVEDFTAPMADVRDLQRRIAEGATDATLGRRP